MAGESLLYYPSGYKAGKAYSQIPTDGTGDFTVVRNDIKTRVNSLGVIETLAANVPSIDYVDGGCPVLNVEAQSTNLVLWSEDFSNPFYTKSNTALDTGFSFPSVDNPNGAFKLKDDGTNGIKRLISNSIATVIGNTYTNSIFAKKSDLNYVYIATTGLTVSIAYFDLLNGNVISVGGSIGGTAKIKPLSNGWYECSITYTAQNTSTPIQIGLSEDGIINSYQGNLNDGVYLLGSQIKEFNGSYIKTEGTTQTRLEDVITVAPPVGVTEIIETIDGIEQTPITVIPATYQVPVGKINKIVMN